MAVTNLTGDVSIQDTLVQFPLTVQSELVQPTDYFSECRTLMLVSDPFCCGVKKKTKKTHPLVVLPFYIDTVISDTQNLRSLRLSFNT